MALAKAYDTCILSADSRQFYKELSIGTAKPDAEEQQGVRHYFIDSHPVSEEVTSAQYEQEALAILEQEFEQHQVIIMAGGSGMFIDAVCLGLNEIPTSEALKNELIVLHASEGLTPLLNELQAGDPEFYQTVDRQNPSRVIRAVEVLRLTGKPYSALRNEQVPERNFLVHRFVINHPREVLYDRINRRVDEMMQKGLLDEVRSVQEYRHLRSLNTVGYSELFTYLDGECSLDEAVEKIKQNTRRYAKRQLTWFRRHEDAVWLTHTDLPGMVDEIKNYLAEILNTDERS